MIDKRLFQLTNKNNLIEIVFFRILNLVCSIILWFLFANYLTQLIEVKATLNGLFFVAILIILSIKLMLLKYLEIQIYRSSAELRMNIRDQVIKKSFRLGKVQSLSTAELMQYAVEGVEQLEIYYSRFLPQLFYCIFSSMLIFMILYPYGAFPATILLLCMPLIPLIIMGVMKVAKRILGKYWKNYTDLGVVFKENLSGLSTLKAFNQDEAQQKRVNDHAETFRKSTMSLLSMQLNSITIMDIISYSGAGLVIGIAFYGFTEGSVSLNGILLFILLSAEFFIPMRQLGSLFHVAMNGISAMGKLFDYLETEEVAYGVEPFEEQLEKLTGSFSFSYGEEQGKNILQVSSFSLKKGELTAFVGRSGSGKSTFAKLVSHRLSGYKGFINWNETEIQSITKQSIQQKSVYVDSHGYLYQGTVRENFKIVDDSITDEKVWKVLEKVNMADFFESKPEKLDFQLSENGRNLSGGQRQRLLLARSLLKDVNFYVFDEITSGIDQESEEVILKVIHQISKHKIVIFISHRLYNALKADKVYVFQDSGLEVGSPEELFEYSSYFQAYFKEEEEILEGDYKNEI